MAKSIRLGLLLTVLLLLVGCDHATKLVAERTLAGAPPVQVVPGLLDLTYAPNEDIAFSVLHRFGIGRFGNWSDAGLDKRWLLVAFSSVAIVALATLYWRRRRTASTMEQIAWAAVFAGAVGNVLDRIVRGHVVDFLRLPHWPVFNLADVFIVLGVIALALSRSRGRKVTPLGID
jgi:signal peptidase II